MSDIVNLSFPIDKVAVIELADRENRNQFTSGLVLGLARALDQVRARTDIHVIVLHGIDNVFCTGGTREELLGIPSAARLRSARVGCHARSRSRWRPNLGIVRRRHRVS